MCKPEVQSKYCQFIRNVKDILRNNQLITYKNQHILYKKIDQSIISSYFGKNSIYYQILNNSRYCKQSKLMLQQQHGNLLLEMLHNLVKNNKNQAGKSYKYCQGKRHSLLQYKANNLLLIGNSQEDMQNIDKYLSQILMQQSVSNQ